MFPAVPPTVSQMLLVVAAPVEDLARVKVCRVFAGKLCENEKEYEFVLGSPIN